MGKLDGKVAVITGGSRGLGLGIAKAYIQEGARLVIASRSPDHVQQAVDQLRSLGGEAQGTTCDVSQLQQHQALLAFALEQYKQVDIWLNNAGVSGAFGPVIKLDPGEVEKIIQTNIFGTYYGSRTALRYFLERGQGKLINLMGRGYKGQPTPMQNAYASSKTWARSFTLALAKETQNSAVGVYGLAPGMVITEMLTELNVIEGHQDGLKAYPTVLRMWANPPEVPAKKAVWLASSATDGRTGLIGDSMGPFSILSGALSEGLRRLFQRPANDVHININSLPPAQK